MSRSIERSCLTNCFAGRRTVQKNIENLNRIGFLTSQDRFDRVRSVFLEKKDRYAIASVGDQHFWKHVADLSQATHTQVTDIYTSCIVPESISSRLMEIANLPVNSSPVNHYISRCIPFFNKMRKLVYFDIEN